MYLHSSNASERLAAATAPAALPKRSASCPNPKQIKAVHDNFAQCHFSRCHNSSFATSCNARPTLCPQKRWEVYSHIQPFQHWICISHLHQANATEHHSPMPHDLCSEKDSNFWSLQSLHTTVLRVYPTDQYALGNTGLFPIPSLDRYHLCLFWEVAQCKMWMWNQLIIGLPQHHLHASGEWGVERGSLHGPKLCKSLKEFEQLDAISVWVLSIQLDCNLHDFEIVRFKKHCMIRTPISFWSSKDALVLPSILLLILLIPMYNPTHPHQHISASLSSSISVLSNKKPSHHAPP